MRHRSQPLAELTTLFAMAVALAPAGTEAALNESECVLELAGVSSRHAQCATLAVPLDPEAPDSAVFDLFVARIPSLAADPQPDPLLLIAGGPGQSTVDFYMQLRGAFAPVRRNRDIILVDQRGTGRSAAGFECEIPDDIDFQMADVDILDTLVAECLAGLEREPRFFTTSLAVRDLDVVRRELGVDQWNIYGVSYGTRVAQHYLRRYPERVRAVVLDGVVPPSLVLGPEIALNAQAALDGIFQRCDDDEACAARFGDLAATFDDLMDRIKTSPANVAARDPATGELEETIVTEEYLMGVTRLWSYSAVTAALLPLIIDDAARGRFDTLLAQASLISESLEQALSFPMHNSIVCSEDYPFDAAEAPASIAESYLGTSIVDALGAICAQWPQGPVDADFKDPLVSGHPVLLLSGSNDPATPARYAEDVMAEGLSGAVHLVAAEQGHGLAPVGCVRNLMQEFIASGTAEGLDAECLDRVIPTPFFLSAGGPGP